MDSAAINDPSVLQWELHAAASVGDFARVLRLARRWDGLGCGPDDLLHLARVLFLSARPGAYADIAPSQWLPSVFSPRQADPELRRLAGLQATFFAATVEAVAGSTDSWSALAEPIEPSQMEPERLEVLHLCRAMLEPRELQDRIPTGLECAIRAWCDFALGMAASNTGIVRRAADTYASLAERAPVDGDSTAGLAVVFAPAAAACCYFRSGDFVRAEAWIRLAIEKTPDHPPHRRRSVECLIHQERSIEAANAFVDYSSRAEGQTPDTWLSPLVRQLGFELMNAKEWVIDLETAAMLAAGRELAESVAGWDNPWFNDLGELA